MLSVLRSVAPQPQHQSTSTADSRARFRTVLGLGAIHRGFDPASTRPTNPALSHSLTRRSVDTITGNNLDLGHSRDRSSIVVDSSFFDRELSTMKNSTEIQSMPTRRIPFRIDNQDGPWTISVAEMPHDPSSYSIYVKTLTHNITLTRTAQEIFALHGKLRDSHPGVKMPNFPIDSSSVSAPPKRKSTFLNTLSRLASPSSKSSLQRQVSGRRSATSSHAASSTTTSVVSSTQPTPLSSPKQEFSDPFAENDDEDDLQASLPPANSTVTGLAAYLTAVANDSSLRQTRVWKRFVRVRTDDLQSVRVERAIKRVRSDLAAHVSPGNRNSSEMQRSISQVVANGDRDRGVLPKVDGLSRVVANAPVSADEETGFADSSAAQEDIKEEEDVEIIEHNPAQTSVTGEDIAHVAESGHKPDDQDRALTPRSPKPSAVVLQDVIASSEVVKNVLNGIEARTDEDMPSTPVASDGSSHATRIPRSQSADPMSRASRVYLSSPLQSDATSSRTSQTGDSYDDSSISTTGRRASRKKRSKSMDPNSEKKKSQRKVAIDDFEMMRVLGKGCAGKVLLVRYKPSGEVYALKAITKRHVLAHQELQHTLTEQAVLKRMAAEGTDPFVVKLWWSFHDKENLFLVMDFHPGGDLATQLARWGRLGRDRARFYAAEIVEGVEGLHAAGVIYRDLKPENILIAADGHIVLTDFGLSKEFPRRTSPITAPPTPSGLRGDFTAGSPTAATPHWMKGEKGEELSNSWTPSSTIDTTTTFCGTAEYLAPEVIQGQQYSYEVDWWSFGTMLYEMLTGITPFWANNHSDMYYRVLQDELQFPEDRTMDQDTKSLIRGLLQRNPALRMKEPRIKKHPYFSMIDWSHVYYKRYIPPYVPPIDPSNASDTQNFDDTFLDMVPVINDENENDQSDTDQDRHTDTDRTDGEDSVATPLQSRSPSVHPGEDESVDVFDGYSFKGRHSIILDEDAEAEDEDEDDEDEEEETSASATSTDSVLLEQQLSQTAIGSAEVVEQDAPAVEESLEPKTPEARPAPLPVPQAPASPIREQLLAKKAARRSQDMSVLSRAEPESAQPAAAPAVVEEPKPIKPIVKPQPRPNAARQRGRREKSGIPALDRDLSDAHEDGIAAERDEDDDDWDFVEAEVTEERNGAKGTSLFARGVVDRYKLAVFRKSTPRRSGGPRSFSGLSVDSDLGGTESPESPSPSDKQRRGRNPGLTFRKHPRQFLRQKSPHSSSRSTAASKTLTHSTSATLSTSSSAGMLSPATSANSTLPDSPSLRSKESAISMLSPSESSDLSFSGEYRGADGTIRGASVVSLEEDKQKSKGLKKYKEGAEKVLSIFQSPR
ncbi:uncharacterized protein FIBRA_09519 [Fibroporia radiculosa]|uniref:Protein kinase domain-containing protein n=1 Tax=Fibroporia radiculosa TaxID=599839 RepID=J7SD47_9APHY|nr:uncharacterized protein FIBRA_09519 [Fibroporia radiculosa]CCM07178.1 predicted protein [Fibroporia radiculosa]